MAILRITSSFGKASAPKMARVVYAHNLFRQRGEADFASDCIATAEKYGQSQSSPGARLTT